jgi:hypothetical protein
VIYENMQMTAKEIRRPIRAEKYEDGNDTDGDSFTFLDASWPPKRHKIKIMPCFGGRG